MHRLKKQQPPFGSREAPVFEGSYSEGLIEVIDGNCTVNFAETRDRLLKLGYAELLEDPTPAPQPKQRKRR